MKKFNNYTEKIIFQEDGNFWVREVKEYQYERLEDAIEHVNNWHKNHIKNIMDDVDEEL